MEKTIILNVSHLFLFLPSCSPLTQLMLLHLKLLVLGSDQSSPLCVLFVGCLMRFVLSSFCTEDAVLSPSPPSDTWENKTARNAHLASQLSHFKEEVCWIYGLLKFQCKLETSWREMLCCMFVRVRIPGWVTGVTGMGAGQEKHFVATHRLLATQVALGFS